MDPTGVLLDLIEDDFLQTDPPGDIRVYRDCEGPLSTYDVTIYRRGRFALWVSEDCFWDHAPTKIREALNELQWIKKLEKHDRLLLTARGDSIPNIGKRSRWDRWCLCWDW